MPKRNEPCPCGSGRKYKHCCGKEAAARNSAPASPPPNASRAAPITLPDGKTVSVPAAIQTAVQLHQAGRPRKADEIYTSVLRVEPNNADALHLHGLVAHQLGQNDTAVAFIGRAIALNPNVAMFHNNLGETYLAMNRLDEARTECLKALALQPDFPEAHYNSGMALREQGQLDQAIAEFEHALKCNPDYIGAHAVLVETLHKRGDNDNAVARCHAALSKHPDNPTLLCCLGIVLRKSSRLDEAIEHYRQAIARCPNAPELYNNLAIAYQSAKRPSEAAECYRKLLELQPGNTTARHLLSALERVSTDRAPANYVRETFDNYAPGFDKHLVEKLDYHIPRILAGLIRDIHGGQRHEWDILDLGCGTGLFGLEIQDFRGRLVGVDLSPKMIERARTRGIYDELIVGDLAEHISTVRNEAYDMAVATDVFVYLGDLSAIFTGAQRVLRPGGLFCFSSETCPDDAGDFVLNVTGRYAQSNAYIRRLCERHHFLMLSCVPVAVRKEEGQPIAGHVYVLKKSGDIQTSP